MNLVNAKVTTLYKRPDYTSYDEKIEYFIKISFAIPGGVAEYDIPTTKEINESLEKATQLGAK